MVVAVVAAATAGAAVSVSASASAGAGAGAILVGAGAIPDMVGAAGTDLAGAILVGAGAIPDTAGVDITQATLITDTVTMDVTVTIEAGEDITEQDQEPLHITMQEGGLISEVPVEFAPIQEQEQIAEGLILAVEELQQPGATIDQALQPGVIGLVQMVFNATGPIVLAEVRVHSPAITVVTVPTVEIHNARVLTGEGAVPLQDPARVLTGQIRLADQLIQGLRVHLQDEVQATEVLLAPIAHGVRVAEAPDTEVQAEAAVREVRALEVRAEEEAQAVRLGLREVRSDPLAEADQAAADQVAADQVADEADNNSIIRL